jgi:hypothetical protein
MLRTKESMAKQHVRCCGGERTYGRRSEIDVIDPRVQADS